MVFQAMHFRFRCDFSPRGEVSCTNRYCLRASKEKIVFEPKKSAEFRALLVGVPIEKVVSMGVRSRLTDA